MLVLVRQLQLLRPILLLGFQITERLIVTDQPMVALLALYGWFHLLPESSRLVMGDFTRKTVIKRHPHWFSNVGAVLSSGLLIQRQQDRIRR
jgi:hypothetical protein